MGGTEMREREKRKVVVIGATGVVGRAVSSSLRADGHAVREVSRRHGIRLQDQQALNEAFASADTAYLMIPFDVTVPDLHRFEDMVADRLIEAISDARIERIVLLSGLSAHIQMGTSLGAARMESRLDQLQIPQLIHLRAAFFNENFVSGMSFADQAKTGVFATPFSGDLKMPFIAAADVAERVADLLSAETWPYDRILELHGGSSLTFADATAVLGDVLGLKVRYKTIAPEAAHNGMVASGMSSSFADALIETSASFNRGDRWALEPASPRNTTPTTLRQWAEQNLVALADAT